MAGVLGESQRSTCSSSGSALTGQGWPLRKNNGSAPNNSGGIARSNASSGSLWGDFVAFGLDPAYGTQGFGVNFAVMYHPASGGGPYPTYYTDTAGVVFNHALYTGWPPEIAAGVYEITADVSGQPCANKLMLTVVATDMYYGTAAWYAEDLPVGPTGVWERRVRVDET